MAAIVTYAPKLTGGVSQLQYVHGVDDVALGNPEDGPCWTALKTGLVVMGIAGLLGFQPSTARWAGMAGVGFALLKWGK